MLYENRHPEIVNYRKAVSRSLDGVNNFLWQGALIVGDADAVTNLDCGFVFHLLFMFI